MQDQYCLTAVINIEEIVSPIESQRDKIEETAASLIQSCVAVMSVVLFGIVLPLTVIVAI